MFYIVMFSEGIYVIHAFEKRTRKTPKRDMELARIRLRELIRIRRGKEKG
jgi:phage-related protein